MNERLISECLDPFLCMTDLTIFQGHTSLYILGIACCHMEFTGPMAYLTPCNLQVWCLFRADKAARFAISSGVAGVAPPNLLFCQPLFHPFDALEGPALSGIRHKTVIFGLMAFSTGLCANIFRCYSFSFSDTKRQVDYHYE